MKLDASAASRVTDGEPFVIALDAPLARDASLTGGKASALSKAVGARVQIAPGVVLTTAFAASVAGGVQVRDHPAARRAYELVDGDAQRLAVRSSSVVEDSSLSSMAGQFLTVLDVAGADAFFDAVHRVLESSRRLGVEQPMAVLVQHMVDPVVSGVMFGVDPVSGRSDRVVVTAVTGPLHRLVDGVVAGSHYVLRHNAKVVSFAAHDGPALSARELRRLLRLEARTRRLFGAPQDMEWAIAAGGRVWLLQSRPVTTETKGVPSGAVYGPGPVAETFPEPLSELEHDLWVPPLHDAVREAAVLAGVASRRRLEATDVVVTLGGSVAIDLDLAGEVPRQRTVRRILDPRPATRRLAAAWRIGRLRRALPSLSEMLLDRVDADLLAVPALSELSDRQLGAILRRSHAVLRSLHAHEILMGTLTSAGDAHLTGAAVAVRALHQARADGVSDDEALERAPVVLTLAPPRVGPSPALPQHVDLPITSELTSGGDANAVLREALRIRVRWVHELTARAAWELGQRAADAGELADPEHVRHVPLEQLAAVAAGRAMLVGDVVTAHRHEVGGPLPARFQISDLGHAIPVELDQKVRGARGAGGGVGIGRVSHDAHDPPPGSVLVTVTLRPEIGPQLAHLKGIVAETGSVLSHLAILAREAGVPIVVGYVGATRELRPGALVSVDGSTGEVTVQHEGGVG